MTQDRSRAGWIAVAIVVVVCLAVIATTASLRASQDAHHRSDEFWSQLNVNGMEAERYSELQSMFESADAVVVGAFDTVVDGRTFGAIYPEREYPEAELIRMGEAQLRVESPLSGMFEADEIVRVEFMLPDGVAAGELDIPHERAVYFLRSLARDAESQGHDEAIVAENSPFFRLVVQHAVFRDIGGEVHILPGASDNPLFTQYDGMDFDEFLSMLPGN